MTPWRHIQTLWIVVCCSSCTWLFSESNSRDAGAGDARNGADGRDSGNGQEVDAATSGPKLVFLSSATTTASFGGLPGADQFCQLLATNAALPGDYKAWLSDSTGSPSDRFVKSDGPYMLVSGGILATNWNNLVDGAIDNPITHDEYGNVVPPSGICQTGDVWSNTGTNGEIFDVSMSCADWTGTGISKPGNYLSRSLWTVSGCIFVDCLDRLPFYCFQQ